MQCCTALQGLWRQVLRQVQRGEHDNDVSSRIEGAGPGVDKDEAVEGAAAAEHVLRRLLLGSPGLVYRDALAAALKRHGIPLTPREAATAPPDRLQAAITAAVDSIQCRCVVD
jgi:hypothetical protein